MVFGLFGFRPIEGLPCVKLGSFDSFDLIELVTRDEEVELLRLDLEPFRFLVDSG